MALRCLMSSWSLTCSRARRGMSGQELRVERAPHAMRIPLNQKAVTGQKASTLGSSLGTQLAQRLLTTVLHMRQALQGPPSPERVALPRWGPVRRGGC